MVRCLCGLLLVIGVAFSDCPSGCCCPRPGALVLCESLGLRSLPRSVPLSTAVLSVARNQLCDVDHLLLPFSGLQELSLSHNQLPHFPKGLPPSLEALQLQQNRLTYLTAGGLRRLGNLTRLDLEDNRIRVIQPGAFLGLAKLQVLSLRGNRLLSLPLALPDSLTHLDLSANCISALDLPSLASLVNLQVLKINSNCLRSVPESAFAGLRRLRTVQLADNLWGCECDILYLYRWLLDGRLRLATDLVCTTPLHLAHRLLLALPVTAICPRALRPDATLPPRASVEARAKPTGASGRSATGRRKPAPAEERSRARLLPPHYALEGLSYEDCLSLNSTSAPAPPTAPPCEDSRCTDNATSSSPPGNRTQTEITSPVLPTHKAGSPPATPSGPAREPPAIAALLAVLCALVLLVLLAVLLLLKKILHRDQRVAPVQVS